MDSFYKKEGLLWILLPKSLCGGSAGNCNPLGAPLVFAFLPAGTFGMPEMRLALETPTMEIA